MSGHSANENIYGYAYTTTAAPPFGYVTPAPSHQSHTIQNTDASSRRSYGPVLQHTFGYNLANEPFQEGVLPASNWSSRTLLEVVSFSPTSATPGSEVTINIRSIRDLSQHSFRYLILFDDEQCEATLLKLNSTDPFFYFTLTGQIPQHDGLPSSDSISLHLAILDQNGQNYGTYIVGILMMQRPQQYRPIVSPQDLPRKRRVSEESVPSGSIPTKKLSMQQLRGRTRGQSIGTSTSNPSDLKGTQQHYQSESEVQHKSPRLPGLPVSVPRTSRLRNASSFPSESSDNSNRNARSQQNYYSLATDAPISTQHKSNQIPTSSSDKPTLIRTSTLYPTQISGPGTTPSTQSFNPYSIYPTQAILKMGEDLNKMAEGWSQEEKAVRRRLVEFNREQVNSVITASFKPVTLEERAPNSICVSCIWWNEKREAFITSVDTIYLLESLVAVRFTVEEKNRIRRNMEGFRPLTVSKGKADSEEFFKIIMAFPSPKPRNIEKDVKVFPWKILGTALKKIISKYSASYSSTASSLAPQATGGSIDRRTSPSSTSSSMTSLPPGSGVTSALSPQTQDIGVSRSLSRSVPPEMIAPSAQTQYPIYSTMQGNWSRSQHTAELPAYALTGSWALGQYTESPGTTLLPSEYTYEQHAPLQGQSGSNYSNTSHTYMPYGHGTSQP